MTTTAEESNYQRGYRHAEDDIKSLGLDNTATIAESLDEARLSMYVVGYRTCVSVHKERLAN